MVIAKVVHYDMCPRATVEDIAKNVKALYCQTLYDIADGYYEMVCPPSFDDGIDDGYIIGMFACVVGTLMHQFLNNVGILFG